MDRAARCRGRSHGRGDLRCGYAGIETGRRRRLYLGHLTSGVTWVASARPRRTGRKRDDTEYDRCRDHNTE